MASQSLDSEHDNKAPVLGNLSVESLSTKALKKLRRDGRVVCFAYSGEEALRIFFANPKDLSVYHVVDFEYARYGLDACSGMTCIGFTLVGSQIYVLGAGGHYEVSASVDVHYYNVTNKGCTGSNYEWKRGPNLNTHKYKPWVFSVAGSIYVLSTLHNKSWEPFEVLKKGGHKWESLRVPGIFTHENTRLYGSSVFEDGKKILILIVDRSYCGETLYTYDAELNVWDGPRTVSLSDYTFPVPVNDLDLLNCNNYRSFVINAYWGSVKEAIQKPLGLMNVETLMENLEDPFDRGDVMPCSWHLIPLWGKKLCLLSLYRRSFEEIGYKSYFKSYVRFGTFELIPPHSEQTSASDSEPYQYDFKNKDVKFIDIAPDGDLFLLPHDIVCTQVGLSLQTS